MIESNDKQLAQAGSEKHQPVQSLASEVYQWGSHKLDDAKAWAKEHPKAATAAEVTTLAAGAGLVFLATKGHGGQAMAADAVSEAATLGVKSAGSAAVREVGAAGAKAAVELGSDAALSAKALNANLGTDLGRLGTQALAGDAGSISAKVLGTGVTQDTAALVRATGGSLDANLTKSVLADVDVAGKTAVTSGDATVAAAKGGLPNADLAAKTAADAEHHGILSSRLAKLGIGLPVMTLGALSLAGCDDSSNSNSNTTTVDGSTSNPEDEKPEAARVYQTPEECAKDGVFTKNFCDTQFEAAQKTHMEVAPKFQSKEECEDETGTKCEAAPAPDASTLVASPSAGGNSDGTTNTPGQPGQSGQPGDATVSAGGTQTVVVHDHNSGGWFMPYMMGYMIGHNSGSVSSGYSSDRDRDRNTAGGSGYIARPLYSSPGSTSGTSSGFITPEGRNIGTRTGAVDVPAATMSRSTIGSSAHTEAGHTTGVSRGVFGAGRGGAFGFGG